MGSTLASSVLGGSYAEVRRPERSARRKRQNSEGDSLVWERQRGCESESEMVSSTSSLRINQRRGSEGSEVEEGKKGVFMQLLQMVRLREDKKKQDYESDVDEGRASSRERGTMGRVVHRLSRTKLMADHHPDHFRDFTSLVFDPSAVPERPKSACDNTLLRNAEKLYSGLGSVRAYSGEPEAGDRVSAERLNEVREAQARAVAASCHSRENSVGRARSAEREAAGIRTPKAVPVPRVPQGSRSGEFSLGGGQGHRARRAAGGAEPQVPGAQGHGRDLLGGHGAPQERVQEGEHLRERSDPVRPDGRQAVPRGPARPTRVQEAEFPGRPSLRVEKVEHDAEGRRRRRRRRRRLGRHEARDAAEGGQFRGARGGSENIGGSCPGDKNIKAKEN
ncbi:uncharacterized protein LOC125040720 [Penaeus chinensis]|uniref:uncharacterized protein LOC125040720 n=1 Tax=Penaeus chinensis TaxID=139456 RepID=UPI001FB5D9C7|nr:uncharacterized protein LOC125040720 [Penaeus chinensis]